MPIDLSSVDGQVLSVYVVGGVSALIALIMIFLAK